MERPELSQEELDRKLRAYFRQEAADIQPSPEWWDQAMARLGEQERPGRLFRLTAWLHGVPRLPAMAGIAASLMLVVLAAATVLFGGQGSAGEPLPGLESRWDLISQTGAVTPPTPSPAAGAAFDADITASGGLAQEDAGRTTRNSVAVQFFSDMAASDEEAAGPFLTVTFELSRCPAQTSAALHESGFAFDGTVTTAAARSERPQVTFQVHRWLKGGDSPFVMVSMSSRIEGMTAPEPGQRWLVAGNRNDEQRPRAGGCGISRPYTEEAAREWAEALAP